MERQANCVNPQNGDSSGTIVATGPVSADLGGSIVLATTARAL
jgi:hypothetical protein